MCLLPIFTLLLVCNMQVFGGNELRYTGARSMGLGNASLLLTDAWATSHNQANLARLSQWTVSGAFQNQFFVPGLAQQSLALAMPTRSGTLGMVVHNYGIAAYQETKVGLGYGLQLAENLSMGVALDYFQTRIAEGYGSTSALAVEVGIVAQPIEDFTLAAHVFNPTQARLAEYNDERIPTVLNVAAGYVFSDKVNLNVQLEKDIDLPLNTRLGIEYEPITDFQLRLGFSTYLRTMSIGFGYRFKGLQIDIAAANQAQIGYHSAVSLAYVFKQKNKS